MTPAPASDSSRNSRPRPLRLSHGGSFLCVLARAHPFDDHAYADTEAFPVPFLNPCNSLAPHKCVHVHNWFRVCGSYDFLFFKELLCLGGFVERRILGVTVAMLLKRNSPPG